MIRIANCSGFYGDRLSAAREQVMGGEIDVLTGDWLAELTMLILFKDRMKNPDGGYAKTFLLQLRDVLGPCLQKGIKIVSNAGGLNPQGLADAIAAAAEKAGAHPKIAVVHGDNLIEPTYAWKADGTEPLEHLDTGVPLKDFPGPILTSNAYLGCWPIVKALQEGADIVITGRCTDAAVVMGPAAWKHGWSPEDVDALAGALVAGHIIECGCQATGGNYPFWEEVPSFHDVGFPIAEIEADGSSVITKHPGTGGLVSVGTCTAQLMYEVQSDEYYSPDAIAHLDTVRLEQEGDDRVRVSGVRGSPPTEQLKLGINVAAGYRNSVKVLLSGHDAKQKAAVVSKVFWQAAGTDFDETRTDLIDAFHPDPKSENDNFTHLVFSARDSNQKKVGRAFTGPAIEMALASVPGFSLVELPGRPQTCGMFWPTLIDRSRVAQTVTLGDQTWEVPHPPTGPLISVDAPVAPEGVALSGQTKRLPLGTLVGARSGDKGGNANVGFWVRDPAHYAWMDALLSPEQLEAWLPEFSGDIQRYAFPNFLAINFILEGILGDGVAASLRRDPQGKCLGEYFRSQLVDVDEALLRTGG